jgi:hypothetical protein
MLVRYARNSIPNRSYLYCRGIERVLKYGLALRLLSSGVGGNNNNNTKTEIVFDSASALRASALDTPHVPEYCMGALEVRA